MERSGAGCRQKGTGLLRAGGLLAPVGDPRCPDALLTSCRIEPAKPLPRDHPTAPSQSDWTLAEDAAPQLRRVAGRPNGPLLNKALIEILAIHWQTVSRARATARYLPYGARLPGDGAIDRIALQSQTSRGKRFELGRILGDAVWTRHSNFGVISRGKTDRQKFQRAFAQSLICPFDDLRSHVDLTNPTDDQIEAAARRYHVHRSVVTTLLVHKNILPRETLGEKIEAA
jgi:hypothetical protein